MTFTFSKQFAAEIMAFAQEIPAIKYFRQTLRDKTGFVPNLRLSWDIVRNLRGKELCVTSNGTILVRVEK